jgi:hypothetical protein
MAITDWLLADVRELGWICSLIGSHMAIFSPMPLTPYGVRLRVKGCWEGCGTDFGPPWASPESDIRHLCHSLKVKAKVTDSKHSLEEWRSTGEPPLGRHVVIENRLFEAASAIWKRIPLWSNRASVS